MPVVPALRKQRQVKPGLQNGFEDSQDYVVLQIGKHRRDQPGLPVPPARPNLKASLPGTDVWKRPSMSARQVVLDGPYSLHL